MKKFIILIIVCCMSLLACKQPSVQYFEYSGRLHTPFHIKYAYTEPLDEEIKGELDRFYHLFNAFDSTSVVSHINQNKNMAVEDSVFTSLFRTAMLVSAYTDGAYDITCAPLINLWGFGFSNKDSISQANIDSVKQFIGYQKVHLENGIIKKDDPRLLLNCSSIADGTVCDMIADCFDKHGITDYMVEFGGEIVAKGKNQRGDYWRLGINKPQDDSTGINQELQTIIQLWPKDLSEENAVNNGRRGMATSGNYRNFYIKDGKKYAHTIDPREGAPVQRDVLSATIIAPTAMLADACATACMVLGSDGAEKLRTKLPMIEYYLICGDSTSYYSISSAGFDKFVIK